MKAGKLLLLPFSWVYGAVLSLRNLGYRLGWLGTQRMDFPVISVGNITVGGTGKTPMAEFLLERLLAMGYQPAYLSRGYGRKTRGFLLVEVGAPSLTLCAGSDKTSIGVRQDAAASGVASGDAGSRVASSAATSRAALGTASAQFGDEAYQVSAKFPQVPVAVCEDRVVGARLLHRLRPFDILVLDDAFQHRSIHRNLDIVMVDVSRLPLDDFVLPAGRLREPLKGLSRADCFVLTKFQNAQEAAAAKALLHSRFPAAKIAVMEMKAKGLHPFEGGKQNPKAPSSLQGMPVIAFAGLGNNDHFLATLKALGADVRAFFPFPDHHPYESTDLENLLAAYESQPEIKGKFAPALILTTEKDFFRLRDLPWTQQHAQLPLHYLEIGLSPLEGWEQLEFEIKNINLDS